MMKILFVCKSSPWGRGGASYATRAYLKAFSALSNGNIDVIIPDDEKEYEEPDIKATNLIRTSRRSKLFQLLSVITGCLHRYSRQIRKCLLQNTYDYVVYNGSATISGSIKLAKRKKVKVITIHHNFEQEYFRDNTPQLLLRLFFSHHVKRNERISYLRSDYNLFLSNDDLETFYHVYGKNSGENCYLGVFEYNTIPELMIKDNHDGPFTIAITGSLCTVQGIDGISYFFKDLYSQLPNNVHIVISGRSPHKSIIDFCNKYENVELIANPDNMNEVINNADIYLCPTRLGGGVKLRVMDGLRLGIPVITHSCSARGYEIFNKTGCISVFNEAKGFKTAFETLVNKIIDGTITNSIVFKNYCEYFSFDAGLKRVEKVFLNSENPLDI